MATSSATWHMRATAASAVVAPAAYTLGALTLAGEATVHIQQYFSLFHDVRWIGPLFLANAVASLLAVAGLANQRTRPFAALAGIAISAVALLSLVISYGNGLFGWHEGGFRTAIALAAIFEVATVIFLSTALASQLALRGERRR